MSDTTSRVSTVRPNFSEQSYAQVIDPLIRRIDALEASLDRTLVYIAGAPGTGKSTLAEAMASRAEQLDTRKSFASFSMDGFHLAQKTLETTQVIYEGKQTSLAALKGMPQSFDVAALNDALARLATSPAGEKLLLPAYNRSIHDVVPNAICISSEVVLVEGNWLLLQEKPWDELKRFAALTIMLTAPTPLLQARLIARKEAGGLSHEAALAWFDKVDGPNIERVYSSSAVPDLRIYSAGNGELRYS